MPIIRVNVEGKDDRGRKIPAPNALRDIGPLFPIIVAPLDSHAEVLKKTGKRVIQGEGMALICQATPKLGSLKQGRTGVGTHEGMPRCAAVSRVAEASDE